MTSLAPWSADVRFPRVSAAIEATDVASAPRPVTIVRRSTIEISRNEPEPARRASLSLQANVRTWTPPTLPGFQLLMACRARLHPYIRTFAAARAAVPDGIGWLASQSLFRTRGAADLLGSSNHRLTWFAITA